MPAYTNAETAHKLKQKIEVADKFILVATPNAINSKWCNWELGLGDAAKYKEHIALLPINRTYENFRGAEYLKIYPYIVSISFAEILYSLLLFSRPANIMKSISSIQAE